MNFLMRMFGWAFDAISGATNGGLSDEISAEQRRKKRDRERSLLLAQQWEREDELKRQQGVLPPDWRNR